MSNAQKSRAGLLLAGVATLVMMGAAGFILLVSAPPEGVDSPTPGPTPGRVVTASPATATDQPARVDPLPTPTAPASKPASKPNRMARDLAREQIWSALNRKHELEPAAPGSAAPREDAAEQLPALDPEYIQTAIREQLIPVAQDCYDTVLEQDAEAAGKLVFEFTIIGDEEIGGVVEEVALADGSTLDSEFLRECMSESLLTVTFPPPAEGGRVEVSYPFEFAPG